MRTRALLLTFCLAASGCTAHTLLAKKDQLALQRSLAGRTYYLKYSMFAGPFFEYPDRRYLSERAFDERVLLETPAGEPILPAGPTEILPMGTRVRIQAIELPTAAAVATRKLRSPRFFTWILLQPAGRASGADRRPYTIVLTQEFRTRRQVQQAIESLLLTDDPRPAFADRPPAVLAAIDRKLLCDRMPYDALIRSRGHPDRVERRVKGGQRLERWVYAPGRIAILADNRLQGWEGFPVLPVQTSPRESPGSRP